MKISLALFLALLSFSNLDAAKPALPVPSDRQIRWHTMEQYAFIHFGLNTYTNREWGFGDENPALFNPTDFDANQLVAAIQSGGFKGVILTCKHHDGFCLWPSKTTSHTIAKSPFRGGKGDLVKEVANACRRAGLKFGVYVSPWDRNSRHYGTPEYTKIYHEQIRELLTQYGEIFEIWFDGANGGDGYYGGARESRKIDNKTYYDWQTVHAMIRKLQPKAVIFGDGGPDVRWIGNERGEAPIVCRPTISAQGWSPGNYQASLLGPGEKGGSQWIPAECDVSIRPGWFWHEAENSRVRSAANLFQLYLKSVGRGASFLLNIPPNTAGSFSQSDLDSLRHFGDRLRRTFAKNLAKQATITSSSTTSQASRDATAITDENPSTYWSAKPDQPNAALTLSFKHPIFFNLIRIREALSLGLRVEDWSVEVKQNGTWAPYANGSVIGAARIITGKTTQTDAIRLQFTNSTQEPCLSEIGIYRADEDAPPVAIRADTHSLISLETNLPEASIFYTLDRSEPSTQSPRYTAPISLENGGILKARSAIGESLGDVATRQIGLPKHRWSTTASPDDSAALAIDGNSASLWQSQTMSEKSPPSITINLGSTTTFQTIVLTPRHDGQTQGMINQYRIEISADGKTWEKLDEGEISNILANPIPYSIALKTPARAHFLKLTALRTANGDAATLAEIDLLPATNPTQ